MVAYYLEDSSMSMGILSLSIIFLSSSYVRLESSSPRLKDMISLSRMSSFFMLLESFLGDFSLEVFPIPQLVLPLFS